MSINFSLNIKNFKDIPFNLYGKDFTFHLNDKAYKVNRFIADLLSPSVRQMHYSDKSNDEFYIKFDKSTSQSNKPQSVEENEDYFSDFLKLYTLEDIIIDPKRQQIYSQYFYALGNFDEFLRLQPEYNSEFTEDNALDRLILLSNIASQHSITVNYEETSMIGKLINFISSNFSKMDKEKMKQLSNDILEKIINNENLKLDSEDRLLDFVLDIYSNNESSSKLFEYVLFNNVSEEMIEQFVNMFDIDSLNLGIWRSICKRLIRIAKSDSERYEEESRIERIMFSKGKEFEGIMHHLTVETGSNIHDNGTVEITSNSIYTNSHYPRNLVNYQIDNYYASTFSERSIICFDFKDKSVNLSSYTIKSNNNSCGECSPKSWIVEVSNDNNKWEEIDRHENDSSLKGNSVVFTFNVQKQNHGFYRFIRLRQTSRPWDRDDEHVWFHSLEFNGELKYALKQNDKK